MGAHQFLANPCDITNSVQSICNPDTNDDNELQIGNKPHECIEATR